MAFFPFMMDIAGKHCLVVGGGRIALHKVKVLLPFGVNIIVIAEEICPELESLQTEWMGHWLQEQERCMTAADATGTAERTNAGTLTILQEKLPDLGEVVERYEEQMAVPNADGPTAFFFAGNLPLNLDEVDFVVAATDDERLNHQIAVLSRIANKPVNAVDQKEDCTFYFPAMIHRQDLLIAVASGGQSPSAVAHVKKKIEQQIPEYYGLLVANMGAYREYVLAHIADAGARKKIFAQMLAYAEAHEGELTQEVVDALLSNH